MAYKSELVKPYNTGYTKKEEILRMFNSIAPNYDRLNGFLSLGIDDYWRRCSLSMLKSYNPQHVLDIATGTGDFAILAEKILKPKRIIGIDISERMMAVGREKVRSRGLQQIITFDKQDCSELTFSDNSFDAATVAFGVRNFEYIDKSFQEVLRILKPRGVFLFLELSEPQKKLIKHLYHFYEKWVMRLLSRVVKTEKKAYDYLPESIEAFPQGHEMVQILKNNGFKNVRMRRFTLGVCTLYIAEK